jgi:hypothetical protein
MKIRIHGNSIRYRLSKTDISNFGIAGFVEEKTEFANGVTFHYRLEKKKNIENPEASFSGNRISIFVPEKLVAGWTTNDSVGFENSIEIGEGKSLLLLIEKDFVCLDPALEDQSDNYPNPKAIS